MSRKCTIRYGTSIMPSFAKLIDVAPPTEAEFNNPCLFPEKRIAENSETSTLRRPFLSAILSAISDQKALYLWQKAKIDEMGLSAFKSSMTERMSLGTKTHTKVEEMLKLGHHESKLNNLIDNEKNAAIRNFMKSAMPVILEIQDPQNAICEKKVRHPTLAYQGRFDAVVKYKDYWNILDWKTTPARSSFSTQREDSLSYTSYVRQLAAYASAFNHDVRFENLPFVKQGILVSLKEDGSPAEVYQISEDEMMRTLEEVTEKLNEFWCKVTSANQVNIDLAYKPPK
ncbi:Mitochondrial genome maintenance exonuclease 1 [Caenorhabditis elegans]|uniref:Mitochondrial genome maintenance exonuclease 1 n=1 Tax=Caenorhabditis elegans TaxID=6239 RepID=A9QY30_CAEEL|nr:Mitochondrial genome maintenance exonuclease 1 [Caenorhabditis elegans]CAP59522.1 Mitochondrial genome maintenance exonuclease 1 [Caenorhabditis elegans]|eukprot:NP_001122867.1 Mitochondrial genome maintenance exonuclease 1 [Caenorhabditis elegans]